MINAFRRPFATHVALASALLLIGGMTDAAHGQDAAVEESPPSEAHTIDAPADLRQFAPESTAVHVDASTADLAAILRDLGEDAQLWYQHVQTLANPFFEGRAPGSRGHDQAGEYVHFYFEKAGLEPAFDDDENGGDKTFFMPFSFASPDRKVTVLSAEVRIGDEALQRGEDYVVLANSASGSVTAPLAFVGYGIAEGEDGYSSFDENTDLSGRIAMLFRYEPLDDEGRSQWSERRYSRHAAMQSKIGAVASRGAQAIILVNPPDAAMAPQELETLVSSLGFGSADVPVVQLSPNAARELIAQADPDGGDLLAWRHKADAGEVATVDLADDVLVTIETRISESGGAGRNVGGVLRGSGELADEYLVIGAHYDHVGYGNFGSRSFGRTRGQLHPGADDNASGTAGLIVLAQKLAEQHAAMDDDAPRRSILFLAFDAEESGLNGSRAFVDDPSIALEDIYVMLNMDMIGRLRDDTLSLSGVGTAKEFEAILPRIYERTDLTLALSPEGTGPSDQMNFFEKGIPVLMFFTGMHDEYHLPADLAYTVNPGGAARVIELVESTALALASEETELTFVRAVGGADRGYADVRLGIMPDMGAEEEGVKVAAVSPETSAANAGMQDGDVIVQWDDEAITNMRDLFQHLQNHQPGDKVKVTVQRGEEIVVLDVTLQAGE